jgi:hypothetical protein
MAAISEVHVEIDKMDLPLIGAKSDAFEAACTG